MKAENPVSVSRWNPLKTPNGNAYEIMAATKAVGTSAGSARSHQWEPAATETSPEERARSSSSNQESGGLKPANRLYRPEVAA
jgi:hypothetical protein